MGFVLSKLGKEESAEKVLESLQMQILALELTMINTEERKQRCITNFVGFTTGLYIVGFGIEYIFYCPPTLEECVGYLVPLLLFPIIIILLRRLLTWYFQQKLNRQRVQLAKLKQKKRVILEQVMCQETYKVALNLLERFDEGQAGAAMGEQQVEQENQELKEPQELKEQPELQDLQKHQKLQQQQPQQVFPVRRPTPFPIVDDRTRSTMARFVDFIVGEGPQNRFGMICKECHAHNGMLPREEYEYVAFRCSVCNFMNRARKVRPVSPRLQFEVPSPNSTQNNESFD